MKKALLFSMLCGICLYGYSQQDFYNPGSRIMEVPKSPEVAAFEKFSADINMYTGTPNISIPLYTIAGKELSVPVSISYDASGIKVEQLATHIGLGWNLNFGGVISRNVNIHPDYYLAGSSPVNPTNKIYGNNAQSWISNISSSGIIHGQHANGTSVTASRQFYIQYLQNDVDYQPDTFSVNVNGLSGTIFVDYNDPGTSGGYKAYFLEDPLVVVEDFVLGQGFSLTDASGTKYIFEEYEVTYQEISETGQFGDEYDANYHSAWYLTEMISPNRLDTFRFEYNIDEWTQLTEQNALQSRNLDYGGSGGGCVYQYLTGTNDLATSRYKKDQVRLDKIYYNNNLVVDTQSGNRTDLSGVDKISELSFYEISNGQLQLKVKFNNDSYFGSTTGAYRRLKLDGIELYKTSISDSKKYVFEYNSGDLPPWFGSTGMDYWGYFNGKEGNSDLAPNTADVFGNNDEIAGLYSDFSYLNEGSNRTPDFNKTKIGSLSSITYPTGGKTTYNYEQHLDKNGEIVGGLRIRSVTTSSEDQHNGGTSSYETIYYYGDLKNDLSLPINSIPTTYDSSGIVQQDLLFTKSEIVDVDPQAFPPPCDKNDIILTKNNAVQVPNNITYSIVSEIRFNNSVFNGVTITDFENGKYQLGNGYADQNQPFQMVEQHFGSVKKNRLYNSSLILLQETESFSATIQLDPVASTTPPENVGIIIFQNNLNTNTVGGARGCISDDISTTYFFAYTHSIAGQPFEICQPGYNSLDGIDKYSHIYNVPNYNYKQLWVKTDSTITRNYELGLLMETVTTNTYGSTNHYMPTEVTTTDSKGGVNKFETVYSIDYADLPLGYPNSNIVQQMVTNNNMKLVPVQQTKSYAQASTPSNFNQLGRQWQTFQDIGTQVYKPHKVYVGKGTNDPELRVNYSDYDSYGNMREAFYPIADTRSIYVWGYEGQYLLAEIKNVTNYSSVENTTSLNSVITTSNNGATTETAMQAALNSFRTSLESQFPEAMMTTYVHEPGVGVKVITDEKGYKTSFFYDQHNRLLRVEDHEGNILSENEYNFRVN